MIASHTTDTHNLVYPNRGQSVFFSNWCDSENDARCRFSFDKNHYRVALLLGCHLFPIRCRGTSSSSLSSDSRPMSHTSGVRFFRSISVSKWAKNVPKLRKKWDLAKVRKSEGKFLENWGLFDHRHRACSIKNEQKLMTWIIPIYPWNLQVSEKSASPSMPIGKQEVLHTACTVGRTSI